MGSVVDDWMSTERVKETNDANMNFRINTVKNVREITESCRNHATERHISAQMESEHTNHYGINTKVLSVPSPRLYLRRGYELSRNLQSGVTFKKLQVPRAA
jgi:hypothetical protein